MPGTTSPSSSTAGASSAVSRVGSSLNFLSPRALARGRAGLRIAARLFVFTIPSIALGTTSSCGRSPRQLAVRPALHALDPCAVQPSVQDAGHQVCIGASRGVKLCDRKRRGQLVEDPIPVRPVAAQLLPAHPGSAKLDL